MKHFKIIVTLCAISFVLFLGSVSYGADIPAIRDAKDSAERARVQALIDGARKENALDWTGGYIEPTMADYTIAGFKEYYGLTDLKCNYTYGNSTEIIARVDQVLKTGRTPPDVLWLVAWDWFTDLMKGGKLMRYESPYYKEYTISSKAGNSMSGYWVSDAYTSNPMWNVKELEKRGIKEFNPSGWWDFVEPKIAPLTSLGNIAATTAAIWAIGLRKVVGDEWFIQLGKGKPALYIKSEQGETWVTSGEYPICLGMRVKHATDFEASGAKVGWLWPKEGQVLFPLALSILAGAPHPNTAKLFVDYARSARGVDRIAQSRAGLVWGRPGVKIPEEEKKFLLPAEEIKVIPMDWNKDTSSENLKATRAWAKKIGVGY